MLRLLDPETGVQVAPVHGVIRMSNFEMFVRRTPVTTTTTRDDPDSGTGTETVVRVITTSDDHIRRQLRRVGGTSRKDDHRICHINETTNADV